MPQTRARDSLEERAREQALGGRPSKKRELQDQAGIFDRVRVDEVRVRAYYPPTRRLYDVTKRLQMFTWTDSVDQAAVSATIDLANHDDEIGEIMNRPGLIFFLETKKRGRPFEERLRVVSFDPSVSSDGTISIGCYDHLIYLQLARGSFIYKKDKKHKKGWTADEIAVDIFKRFGVPIATRGPVERERGEKAKGGRHLAIVRCEYKIPYFNVEDASVYEAVAKAYMIERRKSKKHYYIESDRGRVAIRRRRSRRVILALTQNTNVRDFTFSRSLTDHYGSILEATSGGKDEDGKKRDHNEDDRDGKNARERDKKDEGKHREEKRESKAKDEEETRVASELLFGAVRFQGKLPDVHDPDWTREAAQDLVDKFSRAQKTLELNAEGNVEVYQGDRVYARVRIGRGWMRKTLFVNSATHTIAPNDYTMGLTLSWRERDVDLDMELTGEETQRPDRGGGAGGGAVATGAVDIGGMPGGRAHYDRGALEELCAAAGFADPAYAAGVFMCESGGRPGVVAYADCGYAGKENWAWGLAQICVGAHKGKEIPRSGGQRVSQQTMVDPILNILFAADLQRREGWGPWVCA